VHLKVTYECIDSEVSWSIYNFHARFYHEPKKEWQAVFGTIKFFLDSNGVIERAEEIYTKIVSDETAPLGVKGPAWTKKFERYLRKDNLRKLWRKIFRLFSVLMTFLMIVAAILFLAITITPWGSSIAEGLAGLFGSAGDADTEKSGPDGTKILSDALGYVMAASTVIFILLQKLTDIYTTRESIKIHKIDDTDENASIVIAKYLDGATNASIFGGDFDFFETHQKLVDVLFSLQRRNALTFYSERTESEVNNANANSPKTNALIKGLKRKGRIYFNANKSSVRATYLEKDGVPIILNRINGNKIVAFRGIDENETIARLVKGLMREHRFPHTIEQTSLPRVILIAGETKSGKTHLANLLKEEGYNILSVSSLMKELSAGKLTTRKELIDFGSRLMKEDRLSELSDLLESKATNLSKVVIEGIRIPHTAETLKKRFGESLVMIYTEVDEQTQKERFESYSSANDNEDLSYRRVKTSDRKFGVFETKNLCDLIVSGSAPRAKVCQQLRTIGISLGP